MRTFPTRAPFPLILTNWHSVPLIVLITKVLTLSITDPEDESPITGAWRVVVILFLITKIDNISDYIG